jgi:hypothetical protein
MLDAGASGGNDLAQAQSIGNLYAVGALAGLPSTLADTIVGAVPSEMDGLRKQQTMSGIMLDDTRRREIEDKIARARGQDEALRMAGDELARIAQSGRIPDVNDVARLAAQYGVAGADYLGKTPDMANTMLGYSMNDMVRGNKMQLPDAANQMALPTMSTGTSWKNTRPGALEDQAASLQRTQAQQEGAFGRTQYTQQQTGLRHEQDVTQRQQQWDANYQYKKSRDAATDAARNAPKAEQQQQPVVKVDKTELDWAVSQAINRIVASDKDGEVYTKGADSISRETIDTLQNQYKDYRELAGLDQNQALDAAINDIATPNEDGVLQKSSAFFEGRVKAPTKGTQQAAPSSSDGMVIVNPKTGERLVLRNGQWVKP